MFYVFHDFGLTVNISFRILADWLQDTHYGKNYSISDSTFLEGYSVAQAKCKTETVK